MDISDYKDHGKVEQIAGGDYILQMRGITKSFPFVQAVSNAQFSLRKGEIHALVGENGAGKSTMMKILYGLHQADEGEIIIRGQVMKNYNTATAIKHGIGMVHQEFMLINELTVLDNIILGYEHTKKIGVIDREKSKIEIENYTRDYALAIQPEKIVNNISVGEMQRVEIVKALYRGAEVLILDEPTAVLTPQETKNLFTILRNMRDDGKTIVFISHKLDEVMDISDRITVMRQGRFVSTVNKPETSRSELSRLMIGRDINFDVVRSPSIPGEVILDIRDLVVLGRRVLSTVKSISFSLRRGEILGFAGVEGNGQTELIEALTGLRPVMEGEVIFKGENITHASVSQRRKVGISHIPEDRNARGLCKEFTVNQNISSTKLAGKSFVNSWWIDDRKINIYGKEIIQKYDIRPANGNAMAGTLSGGNAQKIVVSREVEVESELIIAAQPTRGVDIGSIESIRSILMKAKQEGKAILLVTADLDEIQALSDRILVIHEGTLCGEFFAGNFDQEEIGLRMMGGELK